MFNRRLNTIKGQEFLKTLSLHIKLSGKLKKEQIKYTEYQTSELDVPISGSENSNRSLRYELLNMTNIFVISFVIA